MSYERVEAWADIVVIFSHVPFSEVGGGVSGLLKLSGESGEVFGVFGEIIDDAVGVGVEAAEDGGAAGGAQGGSAEVVFEEDAFIGEAVDIGGGEVGVTGAAEGVPALVVGEDEDHVGFGGRCGG